MADSTQKANHHRRALALFCLLAAGFVSSDVSLWHARTADVLTAVSQLRLLAHLSLNDSAVGRSDTRLASLEKDTSRRSRCLGVPPAGSELALIDPGSPDVHVPGSGHTYALAIISPPRDRAPPCVIA